MLGPYCSLHCCPTSKELLCLFSPYCGLHCYPTSKDLMCLSCLYCNLHGYIVTSIVALFILCPDLFLWFIMCTNSLFTLYALIAHICNSWNGKSSQVLQWKRTADDHSTYWLNEKNHLKWSELIKTILKGKGKASHLINDALVKDDLKFKSQDEEDSMIMA